MRTTDIHERSRWFTESQGAEYTVTVPFDSPHFPRGALDIRMVCGGIAFTPDDRAYAQRRLDALPRRLEFVFSRLDYLLGARLSLDSQVSRADPALILKAGDHRQWVFAMDIMHQTARLFVEWEESEIVAEWIAAHTRAAEEHPPVAAAV